MDLLERVREISKEFYYSAADELSVEFIPEDGYEDVGVRADCVWQEAREDLPRYARGGPQPVGTKHIGNYSLKVEGEYDPETNGPRSPVHSGFDVFVTEDNDLQMFIRDELQYDGDGERVGGLAVSYRGETLHDETEVFAVDEGSGWTVVQLDVPDEHRYTPPRR